MSFFGRNWRPGLHFGRKNRRPQDGFSDSPWSETPKKSGTGKLHPPHMPPHSERSPQTHSVDTQGTSHVQDSHGPGLSAQETNEMLHYRCRKLEEELKKKDTKHADALACKDAELVQQNHIWTQKYNHDLQAEKDAYNEQQVLRKNMKRTYEKRINDLTVDHETNVKILIADHEAKVNTLITGHEANVEKHKEETKALVRDHQQRVSDLKEEREKQDQKFKTYHAKMMMNTDYSQPKPDSHFNGKLARLGNLVKRFTARAKCELYTDKETLGMKFGQLSFARAIEDDPSYLILEHALWMVVCEKVFQTPFRVFGELGDVLFGAWSKISSKNQITSPSAFIWSPQDPLSEKWRSSTIQFLHYKATSEKENSVVDDILTDSYRRYRSSISTALRETFSQVSPEGASTYPEEIAEAASELALDCGKERRRMQLFAPKVGEIMSRLDQGIIRDRNRGFNPKIATGVVNIVISPGLMAVRDDADWPSNTGVVSLHPANVYCSAVKG